MANNGQQQQNGINVGPGRPDARWGDNKTDHTGPEIDQLNFAHHQNQDIIEDKKRKSLGSVEVVKDTKTFKATLQKNGTYLRRKGQVLQQLTSDNQAETEENDWNVSVVNEDVVLAEERAQVDHDELIEEEYEDKKNRRVSGFLLRGQSLAEKVHQLINREGKKLIKEDVYKTTLEIIERLVTTSEPGKQPDIDNNRIINGVKIGQLKLLGEHIAESVWIIYCQLSENIDGNKQKAYLRALVFTKFKPHQRDKAMAETAFNEIIANLSSIVVNGPNIAISTAGRQVLESI